MKSFFKSGGATKEATPRPAEPARGIKLNDVVYLLGDPGTQPDVELVFIHGLNFKGDNYMHWTTWLTRDEAERACWPAKWLQREGGFPVASRVLSLQYDSSPIRSAKAGRFDLVSLGESLLQQLYLSPANIGQNNCPVVFVCHSLGGIVAKSIVVTAKQKFALDAKATNLLGNLKGFFFYSTPHSGWKLCYEQYKGQRGPLLQSLEELETKTHRLNDAFQRMKNSDEYKKKWRLFVVAESCPTVVRGTEIEAVKYASAKHIGIDKFVEIENADHFTVCQPGSTSDTSFLSLKEFVEEIHKDFPPEQLV